MQVEPLELWHGRVRNAVQAVLIGVGLALLMAVPAWVLAGGSGVLWTLFAVVLALALAGQVPARYVLARSGAVLLPPARAPELYRLLAALYRRAGCESAPMLFYVPSPTLNAFAVGDRHDGGIAVTDGLLRVLDMRQLAAVLAHEVSHLRNGDTRVMAMASVAGEVTAWGAMLIQLTVILLVPWAVAGEIDLPWLALVSAAFAPTVSSLLQLALSRTREYAADLDAVALTGDPRGLASALHALEVHHGSWLEGIFGGSAPSFEWLRTHPMTARRIERLLALEQDAPLPRHVTADGPVRLERPAPGARRWYYRWP